MVGYKIGIVIFPQVQELDFVGPYEIFTTWKTLANTAAAAAAGGTGTNIVDACWIVSEQGKQIRGKQGLVVLPDLSFADCPDLDILVVPGGIGTRTEEHNPIMLDFIQRQATKCRYVLSVCSGTFLLEKAGLLSNQTVTTHWKALPRLRHLTSLPDELGRTTRAYTSTNMHIVDNQRYTQNTNANSTGPSIWCSGGVSAGMDMTLAFVADVANDAGYMAGQIQLQMEYYPDATIYGQTREQIQQLVPYVRTKTNTNTAAGGGSPSSTSTTILNTTSTQPPEQEGGQNTNNN